MENICNKRAREHEHEDTTYDEEKRALGEEDEMPELEEVPTTQTFYLFYEVLAQLLAETKARIVRLDWRQPVIDLIRQDALALNLDLTLKSVELFDRAYHTSTTPTPLWCGLGDWETGTCVYYVWPTDVPKMKIRLCRNADDVDDRMYIWPTNTDPMDFGVHFMCVIKVVATYYGPPSDIAGLYCVETGDGEHELEPRWTLVKKLPWMPLSPGPETDRIYAVSGQHIGSTN